MKAGKSEAQSNAEALARRSRTYSDDNVVSWSYTQDRVRYRPADLPAMLRWARREARLDGPIRMHERELAADGDPEMTGETQNYLGMTGSDVAPTNWVDVACRRDDNGDYVSPMRCAIARVGVRRPKAADALRIIVCDLSDAKEAVATIGDPEVSDILLRGLLDQLYDTYTTTPRARRPKNTKEVLAA